MIIENSVYNIKMKVIFQVMKNIFSWAMLAPVTCSISMYKNLDVKLSIFQTQYLENGTI